MKRGRPTTNWFRVYDVETDELIVEGSAKECAEALGGDRNSITNAYYNTVNGTYKGCRIEEMSADEAKSDAEAIKNWDAFCEPIRKKYGIPVRRMNVEDKRNGK